MFLVVSIGIQVVSVHFDFPTGARGQSNRRRAGTGQAIPMKSITCHPTLHEASCRRGPEVSNWR